MGKSNGNGEGWSKVEEVWINSLPIKDLVDLKMMTEYGVYSEEEKLKRLRESYVKATEKTEE